jgi:uncharacterized membrane protein
VIIAGVVGVVGPASRSMQVFEDVEVVKKNGSMCTELFAGSQSAYNM